MTQNRPTRIKSAAFLKSQHWLRSKTPELNEEKNHFIAQLPVSESRFTNWRSCGIDGEIRKKSFSSRAVSARTNPSTSEVWRQVHSTRSEYRLKSLEERGSTEEPVRKNLLEKIDRIKRKNFQQRVLYEKCIKVISKKTLQHAQKVKQQGQKGEIEKKIRELLTPFEKMKITSEERYKARLLKIRRI